MMRRQIDAAGAAGCDGVKAQWLSDPARLVQRRSATRYAGAYHRIAYPAHWLDVMAEHARSLGMELGCSCYLPEDADVLASRVSFLKVSAFEAGATDVLDAVGRTDCPVLISLGMADHAETMRLVGWRACRMSAGLTTRLLHCVSHYTGAMPVEALNLGVIRAYGLDGWSDHSRDVQMGAAAVLVGAGVVEVHLRLAETDPCNPDYACALDPTDLSDYVEAIRRAEIMLGDGVKRIMPAETYMLRYRVGA